MKILIVMTGFLPGKKYGGPPVSVDNFCTLMQESSECYIVTHNHEMGETEPYERIHQGWNDRGNCKVLYLSNKEYNYKTFKKIIDEISPDILYLQSLFQDCIVPCLMLSKKYGIKVFLAPRGELCAGALSIHKYKKIPYIAVINMLGLVKKVDFQSTSEEETEGIHKYLKVPYEQIHFLTNIPSIPPKKYERLPKKAGKGRFVFLSRIHPKKNLISAIKYFNGINGVAAFDIYGPIEDKEYWKQCQDEIAKLPENVKVNYCGLVSHDEVHEIFSKYDAFLFPTFSENFGHVIAEALAVGTPVIISDQTPWRNLAAYGAGFDIPLTDDEGFTNAIQNVIQSETQKNLLIENYVNEKLEVNKIKKEYLNVFDLMLKK